MFSSVTVTISGLTSSDGEGIGNSGNLTLTDSVVRNHTGRGISNNEGTLTVADCVVRNNDGGGIYNDGVLAVTNSNILHNSAGTGGGIYNASSSSVAITNSSITGNIATGAFILLNGPGNIQIWGSAISSRNGSVTITNSTIAGNEDENFTCNYTGDPCPGNGGNGITLVYGDVNGTPSLRN